MIISLKSITYYTIKKNINFLNITIVSKIITKIGIQLVYNNSPFQIKYTLLDVSNLYNPKGKGKGKNLN